MTRAAALLAGLCALSSVLVATARADDRQLRRFEDRMKPSSSPTRSSAPSVTPSCDSAADDCPNSIGSTFAQELFAPVAKAILLAPFYGPAVMLDDHYDRAFAFSPYPYFGSRRGVMDPDGKSWTLRGGASAEWGVRGTQAWREDVSLATSSRLGLDLAYTRFTQTLGDRSDSLGFLEVLPTFTFARGASSDWRLGAGYEAIDGRRHHDRFKLAYRLRYWFQAPLRFDLDLGASFGQGEEIYEWAPGLAVHWNRYEIKAGYRNLGIGDVHLQGPELSLAGWF